MNECYTATYGMQMPLFVCPENTLQNIVLIIIEMTIAY